MDGHNSNQNTGTGYYSKAIGSMAMISSNEINIFFEFVSAHVHICVYVYVRKCVCARDMLIMRTRGFMCA